MTRHQSPDHPAATKRYPNKMFEWYSIFSNPKSPKKTQNQQLLTRFVFVFKVHYIIVLYELHCRPDITKHVGEPHWILCFFVIIQHTLCIVKWHNPRFTNSFPKMIIRAQKSWFCTENSFWNQTKRKTKHNTELLYDNLFIICSSVASGQAETT